MSVLERKLSTPVVAEYKGDPRKTLYFLGAIAIMLLIYFLPLPPPLYKGNEAIALTVQGKAVLAVLVYALILWMTEAIPFTATALSLLIILHVMGVASFKHLVELGLGSDVIAFLLGAIGLSAALTSSGLANRCMLLLLTRVGTRTDRIILAFLIAGTVVSAWVTNMAVAAMLLPMGVSILQSAGCKPQQSNFGKAIMISIAWSATIGGIATPAGNGANVMAIGLLKQLCNVDVSFGQWMAVGVPASLLMLPVLWWVLVKFFPPEMKHIPVELTEIKEQLKALGPCAPGMGVNLVVKVHCRRGSTSLLAKGKGVHREVESEGSRRQNHGPMNKNPIRG